MANTYEIDSRQKAATYIKGWPSIWMSRLLLFSDYAILYSAVTLRSILSYHLSRDAFFSMRSLHKILSRYKSNLWRSLFVLLFLATISLLSACAPAIPATQLQQQSTPTINAAFQKKLTAVPTVPPYRCGAWASNNAPGTHSTITIYARLTKDVQGVAGASASGVVHFTSGDSALGQQPVSDAGGYVTFTLQLRGQQPAKQPATVDVSFSLSGQTVECTPAFFTPS